MPCVTNAECHIYLFYDVCRYAECCYAEFRYAEFCYAEFRYFVSCHQGVKFRKILVRKY
jgi:hypothetical protein